MILDAQCDVKVLSIITAHGKRGVLKVRSRKPTSLNMLRKKITKSLSVLTFMAYHFIRFTVLSTYFFILTLLLQFSK